MIAALSPTSSPTFAMRASRLSRFSRAASCTPSAESSTAVDSAAIQAGCALVDAAGGGVYRVNSFIATSIDLSALSLPTTVQMIDDRYSSSGWSFTHNEGTDMQFGIRGRATLTGEGPGYVMQNLASAGNRNCAFVHWYGPTNAPVVASFETWGYNSDSTWYAGREWISKGSIDTGQRGRVRHGNDGGIVWNPNGSALSYRNNPASAFTAGYHFVFGAPLQSGYTYSSKLLFALHNTHADCPVELRLQPDTGESGAGVPNPTLRFQTGVGSAGTNRFSIIGDYPSTGLLTIRDDVNGKDLITFALNGSTIGFGTAIAAASVLNNTLFRDSADNKLKFKDNGGVVNPGSKTGASKTAMDAGLKINGALRGGKIRLRLIASQQRKVLNGNHAPPPPWACASALRICGICKT